jgi:putative tryptophan/tyrosine transport system substrate-binding protein
MNPKLFWLITAFLLGLVHRADAQQAKIPRIGLIYASAVGNRARVEAFRHGLRELGYVEGKNAAELVRLNVDVIVTGGPGATKPAKETTSTIPIVMAQDNDPVGNGFIASLARPAGNIT